MGQMRHSEEVKSAAMAALLEGQSVNSVARQYDLPKGTVSSWKRKALEGVGEESTQKDSSNVGNLLLELLETNIEGLIAISIATQDEKWIKAQSAAELATFFGVKHDKAIRLIEALNSSQDED